MDEPRRGRQTPTKSAILPYQQTQGPEAVDLYQASGKEAQEWQRVMLYDLLAVRDDGLWTHTKFGYSIPRRNGKNEVISARELYGIIHGEKMLHTAHRVTTSSSAAARLAALLNDSGYTEVQRVRKGEVYQKHYYFTKQQGLEKIVILSPGGGSCSFRTRTAKGGLGEGFDTLIIDEAQEYTTEQESSLKYVVSDSKNPQTIMCGTPPTAVSTGDVFVLVRDTALYGSADDAGWAEWSVDELSNVRDIDLWYECNPSLGYILTERSIRNEIGPDEIDFNIQRLGVWLKQNQKSAISETEWKEMQLQSLPKLKGKMHIGIKYGQDGTNVAMSIALKTDDGKIFVESIDCRPKRAGDDWILKFLSEAEKNIETVVIDGQQGQKTLAEEIQKEKLKIKPTLPTTAEVIQAYSIFENKIEAQELAHMGQPSLMQIVSNCDKRPIGQNGGFGYKSILKGADVALLDSVILAHWACHQAKEKKPKRMISY